MGKFNQNTAIFIEENARETVVCEMVSILSRPQCVSIHIMWLSKHREMVQDGLHFCFYQFVDKSTFSVIGW